MAYALVVFVLLLTVFFFYLSKATLGNRRYEMIARGYISSGSRPASRGMTVLIYAAMLSLTGIALIPHLSVFLTSIAERWFMAVLPQETTGRFYTMVFEHPMSLSSIEMSLILSVLSTTLDIVLGIAIAYLLTRTRIPYKGVLDAMAMLPLAPARSGAGFWVSGGVFGHFFRCAALSRALAGYCLCGAAVALYGARGVCGISADECDAGRGGSKFGGFSVAYTFSNYVSADFSQSGGWRYFVFCVCNARGERQFDFGTQG